MVEPLPSKQMTRGSIPPLTLHDVSSLLRVCPPRAGLFISGAHMIVDMGLNSPLGLSDTWTEWCDVEITKDGNDRPVIIVATRADGAVYTKTIVYSAGKTNVSKWTRTA